jgi:polysaccharide biosynthesis protein PelD
MAILNQWMNAQPRTTRSPGAELETLAIVIGLPLLGYWIRPADPLFVHNGFPWLIIAGLLPALRYGFAHGFFSALVLNGYLGAAAHFHVLGVDRFPLQYGIGILLCAMLTGEFTDLWTKRIDQQHIINDYQHMRLEEFTRNYHLLKVSHDRMEHRLAAGTVSLREALMGLRRRLMQSRGCEALNPESGDYILQLFADYVAVRVAAVYRVDPSGAMVPDPVAALGHQRYGTRDEIVRYAVQEGCLMSIRDVLEQAPEAHEGPLAAVPIIDVNRCVHGVVVIEDMLFLSMQEENLRLLAVIGGHIGDILSLAAIQGTDADSAHFMRETRRAILNFRHHGLPAMLVRMELPESDVGPEIETLLRRQRRGLDCLWTREKEPRRTLLLLMPLTGPAEYEGYYKRVEDILRERFGRQGSDLGLTITAHAIEDRDTIKTLLDVDEDDDAQICQIHTA